jgi:hypothetical protein
MNPIMSGAIVMACAVAGLAFLRFWKSSGDNFFLYFALSFFLQGAQWLHSATVGTSEHSPLSYLARLVAYGLIAFAIYQKNYPRTPNQPTR